MASIHSSPVRWSLMVAIVLDDVGPPFNSTLFWDGEEVLD